MRALLALVGGVLLLLAIAGFGLGIWLIHEALAAPAAAQGIGLLAALPIAAPAFIIATVALGAFGIMAAIESSREESATIMTASLAAQREQLGIQHHLQARAIAARFGDPR